MKCKFVDKDGKLCGRETQYKWELCESHYNRISDFQRKVVHLFSRPGFQIQYTEFFSPTQPKLLFEVSLGILHSKILVECLEGDKHITPDRVFSFYGMVKSYPEIHRGVCVASTEYTPEALKIGKSLSDLDLYTQDDLMSSLITFDGYLKDLLPQIQSASTLPSFVSPSCKTTDNRVLKNIEETLEAWLKAKDKPIMAILGEEGSGKTTILNRVAHGLAQKSLDKVPSRVPLMIPLYNLSKIENLEYYILDTLSTLYNLRIESYGILERVIENSQVIFMLDGLGEGIADSSPSELENALETLLRLKHKNNKILLTGRVDHFKIEDAPTSLFKKLESAGSEILEIQPSNKIAMNRYLEGIFSGSIDPSVQNAVFGTGQVRNLVQNIFWLDLVSHVPGRDRARLSENCSPSELIEIFCNTWLNTEIPGMSTPEERNFFVEEIAYEMTRRGMNSLPENEAGEILKERFKAKLEKDGALKYFDNLLSKCKYLTKDNRARFSFAHKFFQDYFATRKIAKELSSSNFTGLEELSLNQKAASFLADQLKGELLSTLKEKFSQSGGWVKKNVVSILYGKKESFEGMDLSKAKLDSAVLSGANFKRANLQNTSLKSADLRKANLSMADLRNANLEGANMAGAALTGAKLEGTNLNKVNLDNTNLQGVNFWGAHLSMPEQHYIKMGAVFTQTRQE